MRRRDRLRRLLRRLAGGALTIELPGVRLAMSGPRHDALTGLPDRGALQAMLRAAEPPLALLFVDIDRFKDVNDRHGHLVGDRALALVGARLRAWRQGDEVVGRWGGDEWVALLPGLGPRAARERALALLAVLRQPFACVASPLHLTASIGLACAAATLEPESLLRDADRALYAAKARGGDRVDAPPLRLVRPLP